MKPWDQCALTTILETHEILQLAVKDRILDVGRRPTVMPISRQLWYRLQRRNASFLRGPLAKTLFRYA